MTKRLLASLSLVTLSAACVGGAAQSGPAATDASGAGAPAGLTADDRAEILNLAGRYSHGIDLGDAAAWAGVFTDDGVMELVAQGIENTGDALHSMAAGNRDASGPQSRHIPTTFLIEGAGDEATMRSYVTVIGTGEDAHVVFQGRYEDRLRRVDGQWRIAHRRILTDWIEPEVAAALTASQ